MGCDIHVFIEVKAPQQKSWTTDVEWQIPRNYTLFGMIAGVRRSDLMMFQPRGLPEDPSWLVEQEWEDNNYHTPTWLTIEDWEKLNNAHVHKFGMAEPAMLAIYGALKGYVLSGCEVRVVLWFDS